MNILTVQQSSAWRSSHLDRAIIVLRNGLRFEIGLQFSIKVILQEGRHGFYTVGENIVQVKRKRSPEDTIVQVCLLAVVILSQHNPCQLMMDFQIAEGLTRRSPSWCI